MSGIAKTVRTEFVRATAETLQLALFSITRLRGRTTWHPEPTLYSLYGR